MRRLAQWDDRVKSLVTHYLTMVCGGIMPPFGMEAFLARNGIRPDEVASVRYRGHGCPDPTRIETHDGRVIERTYLEFWGTEPSMWHLPWRCKICPDGTGEAADIAAADTWPGASPTEEMMRDDPGTNGIIVRTEAGAELVRDAVASGFLTISGDASVEDLTDWQPHQVRKKMASGARYEAMEKAGQRRIDTPGLRTGDLRARMDREADDRELEGSLSRIAIGKHADGYGT